MEKGKSVLVIVVTVAIVALLAGLATYYTTQKNKTSTKNTNSTNNNVPVNTQAHKVKVMAKGGQFVPSEIRTKQQGDIDLEVTASDRDYIFRIEDYPRFDAEIKKGETKTIQLYYLGVGEYEYTCGAGCTGKVIVEQAPDTEG
jgi:hypothetical protein